MRFRHQSGFQTGMVIACVLITGLIILVAARVLPIEYDHLSQSSGLATQAAEPASSLMVMPSNAANQETVRPIHETKSSTENSASSLETTVPLPSETETAKTSPTTTVKSTNKSIKASTISPTPLPSSAIVQISPNQLSNKVVVLDPGHQRHANYELEPIAPGSAIQKIKVSAGTAGVATHRAEYLVNLEISLTLRAMLESYGCKVYLTRTTHDVNISNIERAKFALDQQPDVYIRIHCNGSNDSAVHGVKTYVADSGLYQSDLPDWGRLLSTCLSEATGAKNLGVNASSRYTGLNWATDIPSFLLELGYMTNTAEDRWLSNLDYQVKCCLGIVNFISQMPDRP